MKGMEKNNFLLGGKVRTEIQKGTMRTYGLSEKYFVFKMNLKN